MPLMDCPCPSKVRFSTEIPVHVGIVLTSGQTGEGAPIWIMLPEKPLAAWMVVPGAEIREPPVEKMGMPSPSPIRCVLGGKIHGVEITIGLGVLVGSAPVAGSRMVE